MLGGQHRLEFDDAATLHAHPFVGIEKFTAAADFQSPGFFLLVHPHALVPQHGPDDTSGGSRQVFRLLKQGWLDHRNGWLWWKFSIPNFCHQTAGLLVLFDPLADPGHHVFTSWLKNLHDRLEFAGQVRQEFTERLHLRKLFEKSPRKARLLDQP